MLASLLALALAASGDRCSQIWSDIEHGKDFKQDVVGDVLHGDASRIATLRGHFLEKCSALSEAEQACGVAHPGRALMRACPGIGQAFHESSTAADVASPETARLRQEGVASEAVSNLRALGQAARQLRLKNGPKPDFEFPATEEYTPAAPCCSQPTKLCVPDAKTFSGATWKALGFAPKEPLHFRYSFTSEGKGRGAKFVVRAVGTSDCDGAEEIWEITGASNGKAFIVSDAVKK
ncbi:MAG: hypothetical protein JST54_17175 [Deltaproteobacteria bacterium]|nr:hypothetical protein [Deltaproteobacteria bacterium]